MIAHLRGRLLSKHPNQAVLEVENGVGYDVTISIPTFSELPAVGKQVVQDKEAAVVESVKAASEVYAPISGEVVAINDALADAPGTVNEAPTGDGWFFKLKIKDTKELDTLMDEAAYEKYVEGLA